MQRLSLWLLDEITQCLQFAEGQLVTSECRGLVITCLEDPGSNLTWAVLFGLFFFSTELNDWLGKTSPKWPILCWVGCTGKTLLSTVQCNIQPLAWAARCRQNERIRAPITTHRKRRRHSRYAWHGCRHGFQPVLENTYFMFFFQTSKNTFLRFFNSHVKVLSKSLVRVHNFALVLYLVFLSFVINLFLLLWLTNFSRHRIACNVLKCC